ncbi:MAG: hypothetical protein NC453_24125 [Muribaculum sp.]|nr:hypothetical protein [Muribaculum sp.]
MALCQSCRDPVNSNGDSHFSDDGYLIPDTTTINFERKNPTNVKFYVEVSGSMNGFFRPNKPTLFKSDVWNVLTAFSNFEPNVTILTNEGNEGSSYSMSQFQTLMNTGTFVSFASTQVPVMLKGIINNLNADAGEVAVLISDMKYSPVGAAAPAVLMTQYSSDINKIMGEYGKAVSIVCATSDYLDKGGNVVTTRSPYYFVILGNQEQVATVRNHISSLLDKRGQFVDNIESGFDFGHPKYSFGVSNKCYQLNDQPTFLGYEEAEPGDTCKVVLKVDLTDYRWLLSNEAAFKDAFKAKTTYGSEIGIGNVNIDVKDVTGEDKMLKREATAAVELKLYNMATDSEIIEWNLDLPVTDYTLLNEFFENANDENDPTKSYSVLDFLRGVFNGGIVVKDMKPNYILVSKEN